MSVYQLFFHFENWIYLFCITVGPSGPMPAHIPHQTYQHPQPAHIGPHHGQQNQQPAGHPAPSPVQQIVTSSQSHPPTSNTPQPHNPYQQMPIQVLSLK